MADKDIAEKYLEEYNDIFADIVNVLVFNGERRVKENDLLSTGVYSHYKDDKNVLHEQERDIAKYWLKRNIKIALCGIENQTKTEKKMPLRIFGYEGASYRMQLKKKNVVPVFTLVLYFGTKHWNHPKNLKGLMKIPNGLEEYINDIRINVFEISWLTEEQINMFQSDFKVVARFFVNKRKNKDYMSKDKTHIEHVDAVLKLLSAMTGDNRYEEILSEGGVSTMCEVAQKLVDRGIAQGKAEGIKEGIKEGMQEGIKEGIEKGKSQGISEGKIDSLLNILKVKFKVSNNLMDKVKEITDVTLLDDLIVKAAMVSNIEEFEAYL